jgi:hypothetical protein
MVVQDLSPNRPSQNHAGGASERAAAIACIAARIRDRSERLLARRVEQERAGRRQAGRQHPSEPISAPGKADSGLRARRDRPAGFELATARAVTTKVSSNFASLCSWAHILPSPRHPRHPRPSLPPTWRAGLPRCIRPQGLSQCLAATPHAPNHTTQIHLHVSQPYVPPAIPPAPSCVRAGGRSEPLA